MDVSLSTVLFFLLYIGVVLSLQRFDEQPTYSEVNPGASTTLVCRVLNKGGQCSWQKDGKPVGMYPGKYEWSGRPEDGECSLRLLGAHLDYDDGEWECQVTASDFAAQDALTSRPVRVVVRVPPSSPSVERDTVQVKENGNLTNRENFRAIVKCVTHYGNPPPMLKWFLGDSAEALTSSQSDTPEPDRLRTWASVALLENAFTRGDNRKKLRCIALHDAYPTKSSETTVILDIQYPPVVSLRGIPQSDVEEGRDSVSIGCQADANPPATIVWRKVGLPDILSHQETIEFRPLQRRHAGSYTCQASNSLGSSEPLSVDVDVKYPPRIVTVNPSRVVSAGLYERVTLECRAEGNPAPVYQWLQRIPLSPVRRSLINDDDNTDLEGEVATVYVRGTQPTLLLPNASYDYQGDYVCKASNKIGGEERVVQSEPISLRIVGAPQVLRYQADREVTAHRGDDAVLRVGFCANPPPSRTIWEWGSLQLAAGDGKGRFVANDVSRDQRQDCFEAQLRVLRADSSDERLYHLLVENDRGSDSYVIALKVTDPVSMAAVMGVVIGCLAALLIVVAAVLYAFRTEKWCFVRRSPSPFSLYPTLGFQLCPPDVPLSAFPEAMRIKPRPMATTRSKK